MVSWILMPVFGSGIKVGWLVGWFSPIEGVLVKDGGLLVWGWGMGVSWLAVKIPRCHWEARGHLGWGLHHLVSQSWKILKGFILLLHIWGSKKGGSICYINARNIWHQDFHQSVQILKAEVLWFCNTFLDTFWTWKCPMLVYFPGATPLWRCLVKSARVEATPCIILTRSPKISRVPDWTVRQPSASSLPIHLGFGKYWHSTQQIFRPARLYFCQFLVGSIMCTFHTVCVNFWALSITLLVSIYI